MHRYAGDVIVIGGGRFGDMLEQKRELAAADVRH